MKNIFKIIVLLVSFGLVGILKADEPKLTPDGYLGYPAFEFGVNGQTQSQNFTDNYSYSNYSNLATLKGTGNYNYNNIHYDLPPSVICFGKS